MKKPRLVLAALVLFAAAPALAAGPDDLASAERLYERGSFREAKEALSPLVAASALTESQRTEARMYLAAALHALHDVAGARRELTTLARTHPNARLDPGTFPPPLIQLEGQVRAELERSRTASTTKPKPPAATKEEPAQKKPPEEKTVQVPPQPQIILVPPPPLPTNPPSVAPTVQAPPAVKAPDRPAEVKASPAPVDTRLSVVAAALAFGDPLGRGVGGAVRGGVGFGALEAAARIVAGPNPGLGAEAAWVPGTGRVHPRLGLRATAVPTLGGLGGGAVAGVRVGLTEHASVEAEIAAEAWKLPAGFRTFALPVAAGGVIAF